MPDFPAPPSEPNEHSVSALRSRAVEKLCREYASDRFDEHQLETRLDAVYRATTREELEEVAGPLAPTAPAQRPATERHGDTPGRGFAVAIMGGTERKGDWTPPRRLVSLAVMGGVEMDFREARLEGVTEVFAVAFWGGIEIIVPPNVRVETNGIAVMGGFAGQRDDPPDPDAPVIRISGVALMGGVDIRRRYIGESARQARKRRKLARQAGSSG